MREIADFVSVQLVAEVLALLTAILGLIKLWRVEPGTLMAQDNPLRILLYPIAIFGFVLVPLAMFGGMYKFFRWVAHDDGPSANAPPRAMNVAAVRSADTLARYVSARHAGTLLMLRAALVSAGVQRDQLLDRIVERAIREQELELAIVAAHSTEGEVSRDRAIVRVVDALVARRDYKRAAEVAALAPGEVTRGQLAEQIVETIARTGFAPHTANRPR